MATIALCAGGHAVVFPSTKQTYACATPSVKDLRNDHRSAQRAERYAAPVCKSADPQVPNQTMTKRNEDY